MWIVLQKMKILSFTRPQFQTYLKFVTKADDSIFIFGWTIVLYPFFYVCFVFFHQWWIRPVFTADLWALVGNRGLMVLNSCTSSPCFSQTTQISSVEKGKFKSFPLIRFPINLMHPVPVYHPFSDPFCVFFLYFTQDFQAFAKIAISNWLI